jgi:hypothetical protein
MPWVLMDYQRPAERGDLVMVFKLLVAAAAAACYFVV